MSLAYPYRQPPGGIHYPESDGKPIAENTIQFDWIVKIRTGLDIRFRDDPNVFVASDLLWYPVEGDPKTRQAPDAMVVFGRPKGDRGSYIQWMEDNVPPQVVFEVLSPGNRAGEMRRKKQFYERFGVEEYYVYDPDKETVRGYLRGEDDPFVPIAEMRDWVSPLLGIRFGFENDKLVLYQPDGSPFIMPTEIDDQRRQVIREKEEIREERDRVLESVERLRNQLRALGIDPDA